jgi:hypothetical protein
MTAADIEAAVDRMIAARPPLRIHVSPGSNRITEKRRAVAGSVRRRAPVGVGKAWSPADLQQEGMS